MRTLLLTLLAAVLALAATATSATANVEAAKPVIRITQYSPLVVKGERFRRAERVVIRVHAAGETRTRTVRTSQRGTFSATFTGISGDRCSGVFVVASAPGGRVARTKTPEFLCPPGNP
jgi:hypothetical protein